MRVHFSNRFLQQHRKAPATVRRIFEKQAELLLENLRHPSLRAKKYDEARDLWQARVNDDWRFYFTIEGDTYTLHTIRSIQSDGKGPALEAMKADLREQGIALDRELLEAPTEGGQAQRGFGRP